MVVILSYLLAFAHQIARYSENEHHASMRFRRRPPVQEPGSATMGINNSTPVAADSYDIVGRHVIDAVVHGFWATVPPRATAG
jgi:hypothetical protein